MRGGRGFRDEFATFHASAYPQLAAQTLAITGDADITLAATETTLTRVWRSWPSLRQAADLLVRARWTAVLVAAERESTSPIPTAYAVRTAVGELTGSNDIACAADSSDAADAADAVVVAALQRLPRVQRRAVVLHYMGGVSVVDMAALSGSSAEHIELLLDDGFTVLAESLVWSRSDQPRPRGRGPDLRIDLAAEVLADTAARLPERIIAPPPTVLLRHAMVTHWSARAMPVAIGAACAAMIAAVAQPAPAEVRVPAIYAEHDGGASGSPFGSVGTPAADAGVASDVDPGQAGPAAAHRDPVVRLRSIALMSLLASADRGRSDDAGARQALLRTPGSSLPQLSASSKPPTAQASRQDGGQVAPAKEPSDRPAGASAMPSSTRPPGASTAAAGSAAAATGRIDRSSPVAGTPSDPAPSGPTASGAPLVVSARPAPGPAIPPSPPAGAAPLVASARPAPGPATPPSPPAGAAPLVASARPAEAGDGSQAFVAPADPAEALPSPGPANVLAAPAPSRGAGPLIARQPATDPSPADPPPRLSPAKQQTAVRAPVTVARPAVKSSADAKARTSTASSRTKTNSGDKTTASGKADSHAEPSGSDKTSDKTSGSDKATSGNGSSDGSTSEPNSTKSPASSG